MSHRELNLKEKLRQALASTIRVISDDLEINQKNEGNKNFKKYDFFQLDNLNSKVDFIKARAEADSSALKKKFSDNKIYKQNLPQNSNCKSYILNNSITFEFFNIFSISFVCVIIINIIHVNNSHE